MYKCKCVACLLLLQEISRLESELSNLESQIELQTANVQVKDSDMMTIQEKVNKVTHTAQALILHF